MNTRIVKHLQINIRDLVPEEIHMKSNIIILIEYKILLSKLNVFIFMIKPQRYYEYKNMHLFSGGFI